jgi:enamine deaminase RidA (YjgF/YER057c/UK114 family)
MSKLNQPTVKKTVALSAVVVIAVGILALETFTASGSVSPVKRTGTAEAAISTAVTVPPGYDTIYFAGSTAGPVPPGTEPLDTEGQATKALEGLKTKLAAEHVTFGDVVMMHAYLAADPKLGKMDSAGWNRAYRKYFGTPEQPNKPSRTSVQVTLGSPTTMIEIELIAVRPH